MVKNAFIIIIIEQVTNFSPASLGGGDDQLGRAAQRDRGCARRASALGDKLPAPCAAPAAAQHRRALRVDRAVRQTRRDGAAPSRGAEPRARGGEASVRPSWGALDRRRRAALHVELLCDSSFSRFLVPEFPV